MAKSSQKLRRRCRRALSYVPRRDIDEEDVRERKRREKYPPSAVDRWLSLKSLESCADATLGATEDEVLCKVHLEYVKIPDTDKWFDNGGTYTLYLSVATIASNVASHLQTQSCPTTDVSRIYPKIVLAKYEGCGNFANTPEWAQREPGVESVFRETKSALADLLSRVTSKQLEIDGSFVDQLAAMRIS